MTKLGEKVWVIWKTSSRSCSMPIVSPTAVGKEEDTLVDISQGQ